MRIELRIDPASARRWHAALGERLCRAGHEVRFAAVECPIAVPGLALLEQAEERIYGGRRLLGQRVEIEAARALLASPHDQPPELSFDLASGGKDVPATGNALALVVDGAAPEAGIAAALVARMLPTVGVLLRSGAGEMTRVATALPAVPDASVFIRALDSVAAQLVTICLQAVATVVAGRGAVASSVLPPAMAPSPMRMAGFVALGLAEKIAQRLKSLHRQRDRWVVGWRRIAGDAVQDTMQWPAADYHWLPDDGRRYYADPFVYIHEGRPFLFVEEFPYASARGIISVSSWTGTGWTTPRPVIERPYHLSWPVVFARDGTIWMMPETSAAWRLELYRAVEFPFSWELDRVLAEDVSLADATVIDTPEGWWMFAASAENEGASAWDALTLLRADDPLQRWTPVAESAVLVDARAARPAGAMYRSSGRWIRPVQDCTLGYGSGLGFARVDRLGPSGYEQTIIGRLGPKPGWNAIGVHTLNSAGGFEVIDINRGFDMLRRGERKANEQRGSTEA